VKRNSGIASMGGGLGVAVASLAGALSGANGKELPLLVVPAAALVVLCMRGDRDWGNALRKTSNIRNSAAAMSQSYGTRVLAEFMLQGCRPRKIDWIAN
jgi:hypothetical protein